MSNLLFPTKKDDNTCFYVYPARSMSEYWHMLGTLRVVQSDDTLTSFPTSDHSLAYLYSHVEVYTQLPDNLTGKDSSDRFYGYRLNCRGLANARYDELMSVVQFMAKVQRNYDRITANMFPISCGQRMLTWAKAFNCQRFAILNLSSFLDNRRAEYTFLSLSQGCQAVDNLAFSIEQSDYNDKKHLFPVL